VNAHAFAARSSGKDIVELKEYIDGLVARINRKYGHEGYAPVVWLDRRVPLYERVALYSMADVAVVTATRDGMNLAPYEYVVCRQGNQVRQKGAGRASRWEAGAGASCARALLSHLGRRLGPGVGAQIYARPKGTRGTHVRADTWSSCDFRTAARRPDWRRGAFARCDRVCLSVRRRPARTDCARRAWAWHGRGEAQHAGGVCPSIYTRVCLSDCHDTAQDPVKRSMLVVSEFVGCSPSVSGAIRVNPWSTESVADGIYRAIEMGPEEAHLRHEKHWRYISHHTVAFWAQVRTETSPKPIGHAWSYLASRTGHLVPIRFLGSVVPLEQQWTGPGLKSIGPSIVPFGHKCVASRLASGLHSCWGASCCSRSRQTCSASRGSTAR
jgi:Glycosyltransferase family 20